MNGKSQHGAFENNQCRTTKNKTLLKAKVTGRPLWRKQQIAVMREAARQKVNRMGNHGGKKGFQGHEELLFKVTTYKCRGSAVNTSVESSRNTGTWGTWQIQKTRNRDPIQEPHVLEGKKKNRNKSWSRMGSILTAAYAVTGLTSSWTKAVKGLLGDTHGKFKNETNTSFEGPVKYINIHPTKTSLVK